MQIEYVLTEADVLAFTDYHMSHSPSIRRTRHWLQYGVGIGSLALGALLLLLSPMSILSWGLMLMGVFYIVWLPGWYRRSMGRTALKMYREGKNSSLYGQHRLRADENGLAWETPASEGVIKWSAIERVTSTETHMFVYLNAMTAVIIPRSGVKGDYQAFGDTLQARTAVAA